MIQEILAAFVVLLMARFALPLVNGAYLAWNRLLTLRQSRNVREGRLTETASYL